MFTHLPVAIALRLHYNYGVLRHIATDPLQSFPLLLFSSCVIHSIYKVHWIKVTMHDYYKKMVYKNVVLGSGALPEL